MNWRLRQIHAVRTKVFSLATLFGFFISRTSEVECFHLHQACGLCWFIRESRQTINSNVFSSSNVSLLLNNSESFLQALAFRFWKLSLNSESFHQFSRFNSIVAFDVYIRCSFNSISHCNAYIKRGSSFHQICIAYKLLIWSAYSVLFFARLLLNTMGRQQFILNHNHAVWYIVRRLNQAFWWFYCVKVFS